MSLGYVGHARLEAEDTEIAIYSYTGENWNVQDEAVRKRLESAVGQLTIDKSCLIEPELRSKVKKMSNGRKKLAEKKIVRLPDISELISDGSIVVDELCGIDDNLKNGVLNAHTVPFTNFRDLPKTLLSRGMEGFVL